nr:MAG TPA: hypothetical protein [Caudoviricetes sp.]
MNIMHNGIVAAKNAATTYTIFKISSIFSIAPPLSTTRQYNARHTRTTFSNRLKLCLSVSEVGCDYIEACSNKLFCGLNMLGIDRNGVGEISCSVVMSVSVKRFRILFDLLLLNTCVRVLFDFDLLFCFARLFDSVSRSIYSIFIRKHRINVVDEFDELVHFERYFLGFKLSAIRLYLFSLKLCTQCPDFLVDIFLPSVDKHLQTMHVRSPLFDKTHSIFLLYKNLYQSLPLKE